MFAITILSQENETIDRTVFPGLEGIAKYGVNDNKFSVKKFSKIAV